jgi:hypothetical protein
MQDKIDSLEKASFLRLVEIQTLNETIDTLKIDLEIQKKRKNKIIEKVKYIEPVNDTIQNFLKLESVNQAIIRDFERIVEVKDSIIKEQKLIISTDKQIKKMMENTIKEKDEQIRVYNDELIKAKNHKTIIGSTATVAFGIILILILL